MKTKFVLLLMLSIFTDRKLFAQDRIELENPSFEMDTPTASRIPTGWIGLLKDDTSPVDIQPGFWDVTLGAKHGYRYLGMVVRDNHTWEAIGQVLKAPLLKDSSYTFSVWLATSKKYSSKSPLSVGVTSFDAPVVFQMWGYNADTKKEELLAESTPVVREKWGRYDFVVSPLLENVTEVDIVAYYAPGYEDQNGNLLVDDLSPFVKISKGK